MSQWTPQWTNRWTALEAPVLEALEVCSTAPIGRILGRVQRQPQVLEEEEEEQEYQEAELLLRTLLPRSRRLLLHHRPLPLLLEATTHRPILLEVVAVGYLAVRLGVEIGAETVGASSGVLPVALRRPQRGEKELA